MALRKVLVVVGTTGAGKTKLSIALAKAVGGEVVNSDAMQMYRGLDVATAKATLEERDGVPHHLLDVVDPSARCDVLEFKRRALAAVDDILARGKVPIIVGGTMYYTQAVLWRSQLLDDVPTQAPELQQHLEEDLTPAELFARLQEVDPVMARRLHVNNVRKVQRSLQVFYQTGVPHSELLERQEREQRNSERYFDACAFWVNASKPVLAERLEKRVENMLASGLVEEIKSLRAYVQANPPPRVNGADSDEEGDTSVGILQAIGYKEFQPYFDAIEASEGEPDSEKLDAILRDCVEQLNVATRQYARRQLSWIRNKFVTKNIPVYEVDSSDVSQWDERVARPATEIARLFLAGEPISPKYISYQESRPEASRGRSLEAKFVENVCEICGGRQFLGEKQWQEHLSSKGHKYHVKRVEMEKAGITKPRKNRRSANPIVDAVDGLSSPNHQLATKQTSTGENSPKRHKTEQE